MADSILVVDDAPDLLELMVDVLDDEGYCAIPARETSEAIAALGAIRFDAVVSDIMMPGLTGLDFLTLAKQRRQDIEVVLVTGYGAPDIIGEAWERGACGFLDKPFSAEQLLDAVAQALERARLRRETWPARWLGSGGPAPITARSGPRLGT